MVEILYVRAVSRCDTVHTDKQWWVHLQALPPMSTSQPAQGYVPCWHVHRLGWEMWQSVLLHQPAFQSLSSSSMETSLSAHTMQTCRLRAGAFTAGRPVARRPQVCKRLCPRAAHTDEPQSTAACMHLDSMTKREAMLAAAALTALTAAPWCACSLPDSIFYSTQKAICDNASVCNSARASHM